jgi:hypothetical protein
MATHDSLKIVQAKALGYDGPSIGGHYRPPVFQKEAMTLSVSSVSAVPAQRFAESVR